MRWHSSVLLLAVLSLRCAHAPEPPAAPAAAPTVAAAPAAVEWPEPTPPALRLPGSVRPVHYALDLKLIPTEPTYSGTVTIDVEVREPVRQIWLHAQDLEVSQARVTVGERTLDAKPVTRSEGRLGLLLPEAVAPGRATLTLSFTGKADRERSQGIYAQEEGGESYLYTFFEPIDARRAFPCFDQPEFKVPWRLRFTVKQGHVALANHPVVSREPLPDGLERVTFAESRPMPSYLVAFMVGPFDVVDAGSVGRNAAPLRFIVPKGRGPETRYAASVTPRIVKSLEDFFDQAYPYEKLDVAVVPRYWGTMEHPGIVALGQPLTLIRPGEETLRRRKHYVTIAGHELGHYWFGDVVTCKWWDDIWLNESLTSWLDRHTVDGFDPSWNHSKEQRMSSMAFALESDSLEAALPVRKPVESTDDIVGSFDNGTTYAKGASVLGMFEAWLGPDRLRDVLRSYVRKHAWGVTTADDFADSLAEVAGPEAARSFRSFIEQAGVPRVTGELECRAGAPAKLKLTQERYLPVGSTAKASQTWTVPVCVRAGTGKAGSRVCKVLSEPTGEVELPGKGCPTWVLLNADGTGYYRASYTREQLGRLLAAPPGALAPQERVTLLADVEAAVGRGDVPLGEALKAVTATAADADRFVLERGTWLLGQVRLDRLPPADRERFRAWVRTLYGPRARALGWTSKPGDTDEVREVRSTLLQQAASLGEDPALVQEAGRLAHAWLAHRESVDPDAASGVLIVAAHRGDAALFDAVLEKARKAEDRNERARLLLTLGHFRDPALARRALALVTGSEFDMRDAKIILNVTFASAETQQLAWDFYREHFDTIMGKLRSDEQGWLVNMVGSLCDESQLAQAEAFLKPRIDRIEGGPRALSRALESIRLCAASDRVHQQSVRDFLRAPGQVPSKAGPR